MSKSVVLVLEPNHESEYGEYANIPAFNAHGDIIGWTGGEVPESGHSCEFNVLNDEGFTTCASSTTVNKLRVENATLRELCKSMRCALVGHDDKVYLAALDDTLVDTGFDLQKLGIEVD